MTIRTGLAAAALCAVALACRDRGEPRRARDGAAAPGSGVAAPAEGGAAPPPVRPPEERPAPPPRRGDRHARAAAGRPRPVHEVVGTIVRSERGQVSIRPRDGREVTLRIGPSTTVRAPGAPAALAPGEVVRASWRGGEGDPPTALSVEVRSVPAQPEPWTDRG